MEANRKMNGDERLDRFLKCLRDCNDGIKKEHEDMIAKNFIEKTSIIKKPEHTLVEEVRTAGKTEEDFWRVTYKFIKENRNLQYIRCSSNDKLLKLLWKLPGFLGCLRRRNKGMSKEHEDMIAEHFMERTIDGRIRENFWRVTRGLITEKGELGYIRCPKY